MTKERPEPKTALGRFLRPIQQNIFFRFLFDVISVVGAALILSLLIKTFLLRSFFIPSGSMLETLQIDDRIFVNELVPALIVPERGDVVVFREIQVVGSVRLSKKKTSHFSNSQLTSFYRPSV
ncbi:MAG: hypothetical protein RLY22_536 [Actinomycetota bacterium]